MIVAIESALTTRRFVHDHDVPRFVTAVTPTVVEHVLDWATTRDDDVAEDVDLNPTNAVEP